MAHAQHAHRPRPADDASRPRAREGRRILRLGLLTTAALGAIATAAGAAQAVAIGGGFTSDSGGVGVASEHTFALSNPHDRTAFKDSFTIEQFGDVLGASVRNQATAESVACSDDAPCHAVSLSFQIVTMGGTNIDLNAVNLSSATNVHCAGCQTVAGAYQFVVDTPHAFRLSPAAQTQLEAIHRQLNALGDARLPAADVQAKADALAVQVAAILKNAAATSPEQGGPVVHPLASSGSGPSVRVYRDFQQH